MKWINNLFRKKEEKPRKYLEPECFNIIRPAIKIILNNKYPGCWNDIEWDPNSDCIVMSIYKRIEKIKSPSGILKLHPKEAYAEIVRILEDKGVCNEFA